ncbi:uncharacterized protein LOC142321414 [Lycorma delicatula]|uniref:uncharacterized protein LOC142321414 n=1 Tax=Lycorma delicatula TaxID=130591 RepID=UPI003F5116BF
MENYLDSRRSSTSKAFDNDVKPESVADFVKRIFKMLGRPIPGKPNYIFKIIFVVNIFALVQIISVIIYKWKDFDLRSKAIENLNLQGLSVFMLVEVAFNPEKIELFTKIINEPIYQYKYKFSEKQKDCNRAIISKDNAIKTRFNGILLYYYLVVHLLPVVYYILSISITDSGCCEKAHFNYVYWLPFPVKNVLIYILISIFHNICTLTLSGIYLAWFEMFISSLLHIGEEIEILCFFIKEIDDRIRQLTRNKNYKSSSHQDNVHNVNGNENLENLTLGEEYNLRIYLKEIIQHHLVIIQAVKDVNKSASVMMYIYNQFCCIELCINLYLGYVVTEKIKRYNYFTTYFLVMCLVGMIGKTGQKLIDKSEKLFRVITEISWINKPIWFKKSIHMMIIQARKPLQIKPVNLFIMNLENTMMIGQASYSYFNLLRRFKEK